MFRNFFMPILALSVLLLQSCDKIGGGSSEVSDMLDTFEQFVEKCEKCVENDDTLAALQALGKAAEFTEKLSNLQESEEWSLAQGARFTRLLARYGQLSEKLQ